MMAHLSCASLQPRFFFGDFTGKERDAETGLDYFGARYFSAAQGRFIGADWSAQPVPVPYADFTNPQTLNLYAYVKNNPLSTADLDGHGDWWSPDGKKIGTDGVNDGSVHVASSVSMNNGLVDPSKTSDMYNIPGKAGNANWIIYEKTLGHGDNPIQIDHNGNNHEDAYTMDNKGNIIYERSGPVMKATDDKLTVTHNIYPDTVIAGHTHAGAVPGPGVLGGKLFDQNPSPDDHIKASKRPDVQFMVVGAQDKKVKFYDGSPTPTAILPLDAFPKCKKNGNGCY